MKPLYMPFTMVVAALCVVALLVPPTARGEMRRGTVVNLEGTSQTWRVLDKNGKEVEVQVPSQSLIDLKTGGSGQRSVRVPSAGRREVTATVVAVDTVANRVKMRTQQGQIIEIDAPAAGVHIGEEVVLVVP